MRYALGFFFTAVLLFSFGSNVSACRFNVRDVGFVNLDKAPYRLYGYYNNTTPKNRVSDFQQIAMANCIEANSVAEFVNVEEEAAHPGLAYYNKSILPLLPAAMFVSPDGQTRAVKIQADGRPFKEAVWDAMRKLLHSPLREKILRAVIDSYAVVLLVEGRDKRENAMAQKDIKNAITEIENQMEFLPKPIKNPPQCIALPQEKHEQEEVLLWSLGLEPNSIKDPVAFVLYGRGRRMGPAMRHQSLTHEQIRKRLGLIGLSCECGLDRSWMQGAMIPHQWDTTLQKKVVENLGFDAENPMVKMEISQILSINKSPFQQDVNSGEFSDGFFGYSEVEIAFDETTDTAANPQEPNTPPDFDSIQQPQTLTAPATADDSPRDGAQLPNTLLLLLLGGIGAIAIVAGILILVYYRKNIV